MVRGRRWWALLHCSSDATSGAPSSALFLSPPTPPPALSLSNTVVRVRAGRGASCVFPDGVVSVFSFYSSCLLSIACLALLLPLFVCVRCSFFFCVSLTCSSTSPTSFHVCTWGSVACGSAPPLSPSPTIGLPAADGHPPCRAPPPSRRGMTTGGRCLKPSCLSPSPTPVGSVSSASARMVFLRASKGRVLEANCRGGGKGRQREEGSTPRTACCEA